LPPRGPALGAVCRDDRPSPAAQGVVTGSHAWLSEDDGQRSGVAARWSRRKRVKEKLLVFTVLTEAVAES